MKKLKIALIVVIVVLLSLISFGGVYYKSKNEMKNYLPDYVLGTDLKGYRQIKLEVDNSTESEDSENTENTEAEQNTEKKEEVNYTSDDYKKSAQVIRNRLKSLKVENYTVSCDESTGMINITIPENDQTDIILSDITQKGYFSIKDSSSKEKLLTNEDVSKVEVGKRETGTVSQTYMNIYFTTSGANKFKNITKEYQNTVQENTVTNETNNETNNESNDETTENATENSTSEENNTTAENTTTESSNEEKKSKQVELDIDDNAMMTTDFSEIIDNGVLSLTLGSSTITDDDKNALYSAYNLAAIIENEAMPVSYQTSSNSYVASVMKEKQIDAIIYIEIGLGLVLLLILVVKYRSKGLLAIITSIGFIATLLIVVRYANVAISLQGLFAIAVAFIINYALMIKSYEYLNKKDLTQNEKSREFKNLLKESIVIIIPELIVAIIFCFTKWEQLLSFGMITFWGIIISWIYNILITKFIED